MKTIFSRLISILLLTILVAVSGVVPVAAQTVTVNSVTPNPIVNNVANNIVIQGTGFDGATTTATFNGANLPLTSISPTSLTATIAAGQTAGTYSIEVFVGGFSAGSVS